MRGYLRCVFVAACVWVHVTQAAFAHDIRAGALHIHHPHVTEPTQDRPATLSVTMIIHNTGAADQLLSVRSTFSKSARIAQHADAAAHDPSPAIDIPGGSATRIGDGVNMVILENITEPLSGYQYFPMTLVFRDAGTVDVEVYVTDASEVAEPEHDPG